MKYIQILDKKTKTELIVQVDFKKKTRYFIASDDMIQGNELITRIKQNNSLIDEILDNKKKIENNDWFLFPINFKKL